MNSALLEEKIDGDEGVYELFSIFDIKSSSRTAYLFTS